MSDRQKSKSKTSRRQKSSKTSKSKMSKSARRRKFALQTKINNCIQNLKKYINQEKKYEQKKKKYKITLGKKIKQICNIHNGNPEKSKTHLDLLTKRKKNTENIKLRF